MIMNEIRQSLLYCYAIFKALYRQVLKLPFMPTVYATFSLNGGYF